MRHASNSISISDCSDCRRPQFMHLYLKICTGFSCSRAGSLQPMPGGRLGPALAFRTAAGTRLSRKGHRGLERKDSSPSRSFRRAISWRRPTCSSPFEREERRLFSFLWTSGRCPLLGGCEAYSQGAEPFRVALRPRKHPETIYNVYL